MAWPLHPTEVNVVVTFLSLFMIIFMLISAFITRRLFMGPAPIAFAIGIIFGPLSAGLINPLKWHDVNTVTLEISRIVLAIQCFGNAIELPKQYLQRHWKSLVIIVGPVMAGGWLITTCFVKVMIPRLNWRQSLACAACFNAIDPVLASTVLDSGFGRKVPKHLRDLLRAEVAANGVTTTTLLSLTASLVRQHPNPKTVSIQTIVIGLLYESIFGAIAGLTIGYAARRVLRLTERHGLLDRPCLLAFYLSVALLSTGVGTAIGADEVNLAFFAGIGLDNDDWYESKTRESFFASAVDLIFNLTYFVYIGSLVPWHSFNSARLDTVPWRLAVGTLCIFLLRRLPVMLLFKPCIPDIKTWREAAFYGHFGPIAAGALFSALTLRGLLTPGSKQDINNPASSTDTAIFLDRVWAVSNFVVVCSSIVHGTSIAVFSLGKRINTLKITITYSQGSERSLNWMERLPKISKSSTSSMRSRLSVDSFDLASTPSPTGPPKAFLRRQSVDSYGEGSSSRPRYKGNVHIETPHEKTKKSAVKRGPAHAYQYGSTVIVEDEDGSVLKTYNVAVPERQSRGHGHRGISSQVPQSRRDSFAGELIRNLRNLDPNLNAEKYSAEASVVRHALEHATDVPDQSRMAGKGGSSTSLTQQDQILKSKVLRKCEGG